MDFNLKPIFEVTLQWSFKLRRRREVKIKVFKDFSSVQFSHSVMSDSLWPHRLQHARPPCPSLTPRVYPNSCPLCQWCHPTISSSVVPFFSCPLSFPASGSFQMSQLRWPNYWSFSFNISPCNEHPGLISFRMDWLDLLAVQGTLKSLLQHHSSKASILRCLAFFIVQLEFTINIVTLKCRCEFTSPASQFSVSPFRDILCGYQFISRGKVCLHGSSRSAGMVWRLGATCLLLRGHLCVPGNLSVACLSLIWRDRPGGKDNRWDWHFWGNWRFTPHSFPHPIQWYPQWEKTSETLRCCKIRRKWALLWSSTPAVQHHLDIMLKETGTAPFPFPWWVLEYSHSKELTLCDIFHPNENLMFSLGH